MAKGAKTDNCFVAEGCEIYGTVKHSIISTGCTVAAGAIVEDSVIMPNVVIEADAVIRHAIVSEDCHVGRGAFIGGAFGEDEEKKISVVGKAKDIEANRIIRPGEII